MLNNSDFFDESKYVTECVDCLLRNYTNELQKIASKLNHSKDTISNDLFQLTKELFYDCLEMDQEDFESEEFYVIMTITFFQALETSCQLGCSVSDLLLELYRQVDPSILTIEQDETGAECAIIPQQLIDNAKKTFSKGPLTKYASAIPKFRHNHNLKKYANKNDHKPLYPDILIYQKSSREFDYLFAKRREGTYSSTYNKLQQTTLERMQSLDKSFTPERLLSYQKSYSQILSQPIASITPAQYETLLSILRLKQQYLKKYDVQNVPLNILHLQNEWANFGMIYNENFPNSNSKEVFSVINVVRTTLINGIFAFYNEDGFIPDKAMQNLYSALHACIVKLLYDVRPYFIYGNQYYSYETFKQYHTLTKQFSPDSFAKELDKKIISCIEKNPNALADLIRLFLLSRYFNETDLRTEKILQISKCFYQFLKSTVQKSELAAKSQQDLYIKQLLNELKANLDSVYSEKSYADYIDDHIESVYSYDQHKVFFKQCYSNRYALLYASLSMLRNGDPQKNGPWEQCFIEAWISNITIKKTGPKPNSGVYKLNSKIRNNTLCHRLCNDIISAEFPNMISADDIPWEMEQQAREKIAEILALYDISIFDAT